MKNKGHKKFFFKTIKIIVVLAAYAYTFYKLRDYDFSSVGFDKNRLALFVAAFFLMPLNWTFEALKWKCLLSPFYNIGFGSSFKSVLMGLPAGIITPARVGEWFGRASFLPYEYRKQGISASVAGSWIQQMITLTVGVVAVLVLSGTGSSTMYALLSLIFVFFFVAAVPVVKFFSRKFKWDYGIYLSSYRPSDFFCAALAGLIRYFVFSLQFVLLLYFFGLKSNFLYMFAIAGSVFLLLNLLPVVNAFDLGVRTASALLIASIVSIDKGVIVSATFFLWVINLVVPLAAGGVFFMLHGIGENKKNGVESKPR